MPSVRACEFMIDQQPWRYFSCAHCRGQRLFCNFVQLCGQGPALSCACVDRLDVFEVTSCGSLAFLLLLPSD